LSIAGRCPIDLDAPDTWSPGDLDAMFVRLTREPYLSRYDTKILSSPGTTGGPWVVTMEDVVSREEAEHLIELGEIEGYERSSGLGDLKADGSYESNVYSARTSTNSWCYQDCYKNATALAVVDRLSKITGINETNSEYLQLLRYEEGQYYHAHHDYIDFEANR
jgi:prolyl 4-hydroxylase